MFEKEAEERADKKYPVPRVFNSTDIARHQCYRLGFKDGAEFGYKEGIKTLDDMTRAFNREHKKYTDLRIANEWHEVSDKLPEMDILVYFWNKVDDFPVVARRHIPYGHEEWVWDCKWGSGYTISQSLGKDYFWKEIVLPKEIK